MIIENTAWSFVLRMRLVPTLSSGSRQLQSRDLLEKFNYLVPIGNQDSRQFAPQIIIDGANRTQAYQCCLSSPCRHSRHPIPKGSPNSAPCRGQFIQKRSVRHHLRHPDHWRTADSAQSEDNRQGCGTTAVGRDASALRANAATTTRTITRRGRGLGPNGNASTRRSRAAITDSTTW
jgi:hypothetical protein